MLSLHKNRADVLVLTLLVLIVITAGVIRSSLSTFDGIPFSESVASAEVEAPSSPIYAHHWDKSPVVAISDSTVMSITNSNPNTYAHNWDENPVAYIPESTMLTSTDGYTHNWDDNPVAYIPESTMLTSTDGYPPNWDDNQVANTPQAEVTKQRQGA